jgi:hypothetical protein
MNLPKTLPSPAGPWGSPCDLDSRTVSRVGGRDGGPPMLIRLTLAWGNEQTPCWIDPQTVTGIVAAGLPAHTRVDRGSQPCVLVLGTPEEVYAQLFPEAQP